MVHKAETRRRACKVASGWDWSWMIGLLMLAVASPLASGTESQAAARFHKEIQPILSEYCYDCHGDGMSKGGVAFDAFKSDEALLANEIFGGPC